VKNCTVRKYQTTDYALWNDFINHAKNATFLFHRDFMEYHSERFEDYSLLVFDKDKLIAVLPANKSGGEIYTHQGLSYGGIVVKDGIRLKDYIAVFREILLFLNNDKLPFLNIKLLPKIYHLELADEIEYLQFLTEGVTNRAEAYQVIDINEKYSPNRNRKRGLKLANQLDIVVKEEKEYSGFWNMILVPNMKNRFNLIPVHTVDEITRLSKLFPENIKLFNAYQEGVLKAGVVIFVMQNVVHFQYSSGADDRNDNAALDLLFDTVIKKYLDKKYISFGSSCEDHGLKLNEGLTYWKESFGATTIVQNSFKVKTANYDKLNDVLI
jgi:hypothetical protein